MKQFAYPPFINPKTAEKTIRRLIYRFFSLKPPTRWIATTACCVKNARKVSNLAALFFLHSDIFYSKNRSQADCQHALSRASSARRKKPLPAIAATAIPTFFTPIPFTATTTLKPFAPSASPADAPPQNWKASLLSATMFRKKSAQLGKT